MTTGITAADISWRSPAEEEADRQARAEARELRIAQELERQDVQREARRRLDAKERETAAEASRVDIEPALDVADSATPPAIIEGIAAAGCVTAVVAESGAGKTFVVLEQGAAVADGRIYHGRATSRGSAVYTGLEGVPNRRLRALRERAGYSLEDLYIIRSCGTLSPRLSRDGAEDPSPGELAITRALTKLRDRLEADGKPPIHWWTVDTVSASSTGAENATETAAAYIRAIRRILSAIPTAAAIVVHHAGWQDGDNARKRERGSSAWRANVDFTVYVEPGAYDAERHECPLTLTTLKVREGEIPPPLHLVRRRVELAGLDHYGDPLTSCIIERDTRTREARHAGEQAAARAETRAIDVRVLRVLHEHPTATSQDAIASLVGMRAGAVRAAIARLLSAGWILQPARQRQPYQITEAGHQALTLSPSESVPSQSGTESSESVRPFRGADGLTRLEGRSQSRDGLDLRKAADADAI